MNATLLDGSSANNQLQGAIGQALIDVMRHRGWTVNTISLASAEVAACRGEFACWTTTPGTCSCADDGRAIAEQVIGADLVVLLTPVTFGGYSSTLKKALDRLLPLLSPYFRLVDNLTQLQPRYGQYPALIGVGVHPEPDEGMEAIFGALISRNALTLHAPAHGVCVLGSGQSAASVRTRFTPILAEVTAQRARAR